MQDISFSSRKKHMKKAILFQYRAPWKKEPIPYVSRTTVKGTMFL